MLMFVLTQTVWRGVKKSSMSEMAIYPHRIKLKNKFVCITSLQTKMPVYTVMYGGQSTSRHPHIPASDQRIFDQRVPLTRTKHKASRYAELSHTQKITDRKPFTILYRRVHMFDQALCLLI